MTSVLLSGILEHNHSRFNTVVTILEQKDYLTFDGCVKTIEPIAAREESTHSVAEEAHAVGGRKHLTVKVRDPKSLMFYKWADAGACSYREQWAQIPFLSFFLSIC